MKCGFLDTNFLINYFVRVDCKQDRQLIEKMKAEVV